MLKNRQGKPRAQGHPTEVRGDTAKTRTQSLIHSRALDHTLLGLPENAAASEFRVPPCALPPRFTEGSRDIKQ